MNLGPAGMAGAVAYVIFRPWLWPVVLFECIKPMGSTLKRTRSSKHKEHNLAGRRNEK